MFPLDMPHQGDMYLWFVWALTYDVAYLSEPMVNYRDHDLNMMKDFMRRVPKTVFSDEVNVLWRTKRKAEQKGFGAVVNQIEFSIARKYARAAAFPLYGSKSLCWGMSVTQCEDALRTNTLTAPEYRRLRGKFYASMGDEHWWHGAFRNARQNYVLALRENWRMPKVWLKLLHAAMGRSGVFLRGVRLRIRQRQLGLSSWCRTLNSRL
jgi:hypothetical protein